MKYTFSFKEVNYGTISIESDHKPTRAEIEDAIWGGGQAEIEKTRYEKISLTSPWREKISGEKEPER